MSISASWLWVFCFSSTAVLFRLFLEVVLVRDARGLDLSGLEVPPFSSISSSTCRGDARAHNELLTADWPGTLGGNAKGERRRGTHAQAALRMLLARRCLIGCRHVPASTPAGCRRGRAASAARAAPPAAGQRRGQILKTQGAGGGTRRRDNGPPWPGHRHDPPSPHPWRPLGSSCPTPALPPVGPLRDSSWMQERELWQAAHTGGSGAQGRRAARDQDVHVRARQAAAADHLPAL